MLSDVGNTQPALDEHDKRVIDETLTGTYKYQGSASGKPGLPDNESDVGGYEDYPNTSREATWDSDGDGLPDFWERARQLSAASAPADASEANLDADGNGFTELEEYLQWMASPHAWTSLATPVVVELSQAFVGYTDSPHFAAADAINGSVAITCKTATFSATACGFASFQLEVTDAAGASMTKRYAVSSTVRSVRTRPTPR